MHNYLQRDLAEGVYCSGDLSNNTQTIKLKYICFSIQKCLMQTRRGITLISCIPLSGIGYNQPIRMGFLIAIAQGLSKADSPKA